MKDKELERLSPFDLMNCFEKQSINQFFKLDNNFTCFKDFTSWRCLLLLLTQILEAIMLIVCLVLLVRYLSNKKNSCNLLHSMELQTIILMILLSLMLEIQHLLNYKVFAVHGLSQFMAILKNGTFYLSMYYVFFMASKPLKEERRFWLYWLKVMISILMPINICMTNPVWALFGGHDFDYLKNPQLKFHEKMLLFDKHVCTSVFWPLNTLTEFIMVIVFFCFWRRIDSKVTKNISAEIKSGGYKIQSHAVQWQSLRSLRSTLQLYIVIESYLMVYAIVQCVNANLQAKKEGIVEICNVITGVFAVDTFIYQVYRLFMYTVWKVNMIRILWRRRQNVLDIIKEQLSVSEIENILADANPNFAKALMNSYSTANPGHFGDNFDEHINVDEVLKLKDTLVDAILVNQIESDGVRLYSRENLDDSQIIDRQNKMQSNFNHKMVFKMKKRTSNQDSVLMGLTNSVYSINSGLNY